MELLVTQQIIEAINNEPNTSPIEIIERFQVVLTDQLEHAYWAGHFGHCEDGMCRTSDAYVRLHFNIEI